MGSSSNSKKQNTYITKTNYQYQAGGAGNVALNADMTGSSLNFINTDHGAVNAAMQTTMEAVRHASEAEKLALSGAFKVSEVAIKSAQDGNKTMADLAKESLYIMKTNSADAMTMAERATKNAMDFAQSATTSDSAELLQNVSKYAAITVGVVLVAIAVKGGRA